MTYSDYQAMLYFVRLSGAAWVGVLGLLGLVAATAVVWLPWAPWMQHAPGRDPAYLRRRVWRPAWLLAGAGTALYLLVLGLAAPWLLCSGALIAMSLHPLIWGAALATGQVAGLPGLGLQLVSVAGPIVLWCLIVRLGWHWAGRWYRWRLLELGAGRVTTRLPAPPAPDPDHPSVVAGARESAECLQLEPTAEVPSWLTLPERDLKGGTLIFGKKGAGKTVLLMNLVEGLMRHRPDDEEQKPAFFLLDPKGVLTSQWRDLAAAAGRSQDVTVIELGGLTKWNPFGHLGPASSGRELRQAGYFLAEAIGTSEGDAKFWDVQTHRHLAQTIKVLAWSGAEVTFRAIQRAAIRLAQDQGFRDELIGAAAATHGELPPHLADAGEHDREAVFDYLQDQVAHWEERQRNSILGGCANFLDQFQGYEYEQLLSGRAGEPDQFEGFERLVDRGGIFVLGVQTTMEGDLSYALAALAKLYYQNAVRTRRMRDPSGQRLTVAALDEYHEYATIRPRGGDLEYFLVSREFDAIDIVVTQQLRNLGSPDEARRCMGSFNSIVIHQHNDHTLTEEAAHLLGEEPRYELSQSMSGGGGGLSRQIVYRPRLTSALFAGLRAFEAVVIRSGSGPRTASRICTKPRWVDVRTPRSALVL